MPCLAKTTPILLTSKHGSGGLECDFGSLNEIMTPKEIIAWGNICKGVDDAEVEQAFNAIWF